MALQINEDCINSDVCQSQCPNGAISQGENFSVIDPLLCTECVGHFETPQCMDHCPSDSVIEDPAYRESRDTLLQKYHQINRFA